MLYFSPFSSYPLCVLTFLCFFINPSISDPRATEAALICSNTTAQQAERQTFVATFLAAMDTVTPLIATQRYAAVVNGTGNTTVYAFGECMKDLSQNDCNLCFAQCKTQILRCLPFQRLVRGGRLFYDGCYLRYDHYDFFKEALSVVDKTVCGSKDFGGNQTVFNANAIELVRNLRAEAPKNGGFFVGSVSNGNLSVYGLVQCWELVNGSACEKCLANSLSMIGSCLPKEEGRVLNAGCYLRYSTQRFYNNSATDAMGGDEGSNRLAIILAVIFPALALVLIVATAVFFVRMKLVKRRRVINECTLPLYEFTLTFLTSVVFDRINQFHMCRGYMAPEYVVRGKLTDKADVYSFGVLVIEVVCGKRSNSFSQDTFSILQVVPLLTRHVWNLYGTGRVCEAVDPALEGKFQEEEASRVLQIGLLCVQASAELRPSMSMVVKMIADNHEIPQPTQPPFLNSSTADIRPLIPPQTYNSQPRSSNTSGNNMTESTFEPR
ncbi:hypothetical protein L1049_005852 [Liquidambar formosana]|uniref:Gnk2-homologous domain-containing protein n=1 Tax=Liquidambar formosana TaxID=63359 RepID=A0AAP0REG9_LIQFO